MSNEGEIRGTDACPDPETLATFLDGRLGEGERDSVAAHLTTCESCYAVVVAASQTKPALVELSAPRPWYRSRKLIWTVATGLATAATIAIAVQHGVMPVQTAPPSELQDLVAAVGTERRIEPRLTGGFAYAPIQAFRSRPASTSETLSPDVRIAVSRIEKKTAVEDTVLALHLRGVATLLAGNVDMAIVFLEQAVGRDPSNARFQSDLSTAYLVRAKRAGEAGDVSRALATANRAVDADRTLAEARFNRAYALELLGMTEEARDAWQSYLTIDDRSGWADEARARLRELKLR